MIVGLFHGRIWFRHVVVVRSVRRPWLWSSWKRIVLWFKWRRQIPRIVVFWNPWDVGHVCEIKINFRPLHVLQILNMVVRVTKNTSPILKVVVENKRFVESYKFGCVGVAM